MLFSSTCYGSDECLVRFLSIDNVNIATDECESTVTGKKFSLHNPSGW